MSVVRTGLRALLLSSLVLLVLIGLPGSSVRPTTLSLTATESAKSIDFEGDAVWVLVLGTDPRGLTDAIQLLGIDFASAAAAGIGIPRDSWVEYPDGEFRRINAAYGEGGLDLAAREVEELVGIAPDLVMVTGAQGFLEISDAVGEVEVEVVDGFTTDDDRRVVRRGPNRFDGPAALDFARTRENLDGGDFERAANHQALLLGFLRGLRGREDDEGFMERVSLAAIGGLETDLPPIDLYRLAQALTQIDPALVTGCIVSGTPFMVGDASVVRPDVAQARRLGADARDDRTLDPGCNG